MDAQEIFELSVNQGLLITELRRRGVQCGMLDAKVGLVRARFGAHTELLLDIEGSGTALSAAMVVSNKAMTKAMLDEAGLSTPQGRMFVGNRLDAATAYAESLGFPVVIKPCMGSGGDGVQVNLCSAKAVRDAVRHAQLSGGGHGMFILEKHFVGDDCRVFITREGAYAAVSRDLPKIVGDGKQNIAALAQAESLRRVNPRRNSSGVIALDDIASDFLRAGGASFATVPAAGEVVTLRPTTNMSKGSKCTDITDSIHPSIVAVAQRALEVFPGLSYAGIDMLVQDYTAEQDADSYCILEVNTAASIGVHMAPGHGTGRNVARVVADKLFPETASQGAIAPGPIETGGFTVPVTIEELDALLSRQSLAIAS